MSTGAANLPPLCWATGTFNRYVGIGIGQRAQGPVEHPFSARRAETSEGARPLVVPCWAGTIWALSP